MRPTFQIIAAGNDITEDISGRLVSMDITDSVDDKTDGLSITLEDVRGTLEPPKSGARLEVSIGYGGLNTRMGAYVVDEVTIEGPPDTIAITASSTPFVTDRGGGGKSSFVSRKSRSWEGTTIGDIVSKIASECGLTPAIDDRIKNIPITHLAQVGESDANFVLRLARRYGGVLKPADGRLVIASDEGGLTVSGKPLEISITREQVSSYRVSYGGKGQGVTKVRARVRNYQTGADEEIEAEVKGAQF